MDGTVAVRTVTYGRKMPMEKWGNAEYILTAEVKPEQTVEDVMCSLRNIVKVQLDHVRCEEEVRNDVRE